MTGGKNLTSVIIAILPFGLVLLALILFAKPIKNFLESIFTGTKDVARSFTDAVGITESEEKKKIKTEVGKQVSPFNRTFYKTAPAGTKLPKRATAEQIAEDLKESVDGPLQKIIPWWPYKDGSKALQALQRCTNKASVSFVADVFADKYKADLLSYLEKPGALSSGLSERALSTIIDFANTLPDY